MTTTTTVSEAQEVLAWARERAAGRRTSPPADPARPPRDRSMRYLYERNGVWCYRRWIGGRLRQMSLHTRDLDEAKQRRDEFLRAAN